MAQKAIGPTFPDELRAAKVPLDGIAWGADGAISYREDVPQAVKDQVAAIYAAHNPASPSTAQIDAERDRRLAAGFADTAAAGTGKTFQCDPLSIDKWNAIGSAAGLSIVMNTLPVPSFTLIAADNSTIVLTPVQAYALLQGRVMPWVSATVLHARDLKDLILAGTPPADITQGWP